MSIRVKIVLIILPLLILALVVGGVSAYNIASNAVTRVTVDFFAFKTGELSKYIDSQWRILLENDFYDQENMVTTIHAAVEVFAGTILTSDTEFIFALNPEGLVEMASSSIPLEQEAALELIEAAGQNPGTLGTTTLNGEERVFMAFPFEPFGWYVFVTENRETFYQIVNTISIQTLVLIIAGSLLMLLILLLFTNQITRPLRNVVVAMEHIIASNTLEERVPVSFQDEIGRMSTTFNVMVEALEKANNRIKHYALNAVVAQKRESKIRNIFQKYVPQELIDRFFQNPESMLIGENRELAILFSDIRSFTTISEQLNPEELVQSLNRYFSYMVEIIMDHNGIIDKFIGDAIMAFFGAPVHREDDAYQSVRSGLAMLKALEKFNGEQERLGKPQFEIGIGLNYGTVTVGNIGTEKKMDYTVIGDMVNVASRLEGLTKIYRQRMLVSELLLPQIPEEVETRFIDRVAVKGRKGGLGIYTVGERDASSPGAEAWELHREGISSYYERDFEAAEGQFRRVLERIPGDYPAQLFLERSQRYRSSPPPEDWDGVEIMKEK